MVVPKVSVIIPVYNQEELVVRALDSIPARQDIEILVIDDCSTDRTFEVIREYRRNHEDRNVRVFHNDENRGVGYTVNVGYDESNGEYIVLLGSDDYFYTREFSKVMDWDLDGTDLVYFDIERNDGIVWDVKEKTKKRFCGSVKFMKRSFIGDTRNPLKRAREDYDFYQELLAKNPTENFTHRIVKHYNFPRVGSLTWEACNGFKG